MRNTHADDAAVSSQVADIQAQYKGLDTSGVYENQTLSVERQPIAPDEGMIPVDDAAAELGITPGRLRWYILGERYWHPRGNLHWVYEDSLHGLRRRLASQVGQSASEVGRPVSAAESRP